MSLLLLHLVGEASEREIRLNDLRSLFRLAEDVDVGGAVLLLILSFSLFLNCLCCTHLRPCNNSSWFHSYSCLRTSPYLTPRILLRLLAGEVMVVAGVGAGDRRPSLTLVLANLSSRKIFES